MQTGDLIELAVLIARQAAALPRLGLRTAAESEAGGGEPPAGPAGIAEYWAASKCRFDRWGRSLKRLREGAWRDVDSGRGTARALVEEILGSEVLTRVWTAVVTQADRRNDTQDNEIVARSVYIGHLEMRHRVLQLLVSAPAVPWTEAVELNRLRRRTELWTDMLLAPLSLADDVTEFAFDVERLRQFAADLAPGSKPAHEDDAGAVLAASLGTMIKLAFRLPSPSGELNGRIAAAVLTSLPTGLFDAHGLVRSLWMIRLTSAADDTQRLISDLFRAEGATVRLPDARRF